LDRSLLQLIVTGEILVPLHDSQRYRAT